MAGTVGAARAHCRLDTCNISPPRSGSILTAIDLDQEVRVRIDTTGVWALDFDELAACVQHYEAALRVAVAVVVCAKMQRHNVGPACTRLFLHGS